MVNDGVSFIMAFDKKLRKLVILFLSLLAVLCVVMGAYRLIGNEPLGSLTSGFIICLLLISNLKKDEQILSLIENKQ